MKHFVRTLAVAAALVGAPALADAQSVNNTGVAGNVNGFFEDSKWQVSIDGGSSWYQALQVQGQPGVWAASTAAASWISATTTGSGGGGNYRFRTFVDLTGYDENTAVLNFRCALDNFPGGSGVFSLNGGASGNSCGSGYQYGSTQTISSGWVGGLNELRFEVYGDSGTDGLLVSADIHADAETTTPEPASMILMATGLLGVAAAARRRKR